MKSILLPLIALATVSSLAAGPVSYTVSVDSSSISSSVAGYIEFQFNQANATTSQAATASVTNFTSSGFTFDDTGDFSLGGVTGSLTSPPLAFDNTVGGANLYDQGVSQFGSTFNFVVTLDGAALSTPATDGSEFFVYLLDSSYNSLVTGVDAVASITINGDTSISANPVSGLSTITPYSAPDTATPEPGTLALLGAGILGLGSLRARRGKSVNS